MCPDLKEKWLVSNQLGSASQFLYISLFSKHLLSAYILTSKNLKYILNQFLEIREDSVILKIMITIFPRIFS